jgi:hypothetical protein
VRGVGTPLPPRDGTAPSRTSGERAHCRLADCAFIRAWRPSPSDHRAHRVGWRSARRSRFIGNTTVSRETSAGAMGSPTHATEIVPHSHAAETSQSSTGGHWAETASAATSTLCLQTPVPPTGACRRTSPGQEDPPRSPLTRDSRARLSRTPTLPRTAPAPERRVGRKRERRSTA